MIYVLKFGGGGGINLPALARDAAQIAKEGAQIVIVVGANAELSRAQKARGITPRIIVSEKGEESRYTDATTLKLLKEVYGAVSEQVVELIKENGGNAIAQIASQDSLIVAERHGKMRIVENGKTKVIDGDLTGSIRKVNAEHIRKILEDGQILVTAPPGITTDGIEINLDGDKIAAKIAVALSADRLIFFANTPGLLADVADEKSLITEIQAEEADRFAIGRMKKKVLAASRAITAGVGEVVFADGRVNKQPIQKALAGVGTRVR